MQLRVIFLTAAGLFLLSLGAVGIFLPILPTTPFVIAGAACLSGTPKLRAQIRRVPMFREHIENYHSRNGLPRKTVVTSLSVLWASLLLSMLLNGQLWLICLLALVGICVTLHILHVARPGRRHRPSNGERRRVFGHMEAVFDILYLLSALLIGTLLLSRAGGAPARMLAGSMALVLAAGDAFHLLPRIAAILTGQQSRFHRAMGAGKLVASITMTVFYILLWLLGLLLFAPDIPLIWSAAVYGLAALRILLCLLPQNRWLEPSPPPRWGIYRNLPFMALGAAVAALFAAHMGMTPAMDGMWLAILLSFGFYLPVVLWVDANPKIGMLMLPKTCAYVWMLAMCLSL